MSRKKTAVRGGSKIQDEDSSESDSSSKVLPVSKKKKQGGTGKSPKKRVRASGRSRNQRRKAERSTGKKQKTKPDADGEEEYLPSSQQSSFDKSQEDALSEDDEECEIESLGPVLVDGETTTNHTNTSNTIDGFTGTTREELVDHATEMCRQTIERMMTERAGKSASAMDDGTEAASNGGSAEAVWAKVVGNHPTETTITYDWIPVSTKKLTPDYVRKELAILGTKEATEVDIDKQIETIISMKLAVVALTKSRIFQAVIAQAQVEGITYKNRTVTRFSDVGKWWASLTYEEASENAEKMFRIQQLPFDNGGWSKNLSEEIMKVGKLVYLVQPNMAKHAKGCVEKIIRQIRINQTKILTWPSKKSSSHGHYISVKHTRKATWRLGKSDARRASSRGGCS